MELDWNYFYDVQPNCRYINVGCRMHLFNLNLNHFFAVIQSLISACNHPTHTHPALCWPVAFHSSWPTTTLKSTWWQAKGKSGHILWRKINKVNQSNPPVTFTVHCPLWLPADGKAHYYDTVLEVIYRVLFDTTEPAWEFSFSNSLCADLPQVLWIRWKNTGQKRFI